VQISNQAHPLPCKRKGGQTAAKSGKKRKKHGPGTRWPGPFVAMQEERRPKGGKRGKKNGKKMAVEKRRAIGGKLAAKRRPPCTLIGMKMF
jgi:hypothetical protein